VRTRGAERAVDPFLERRLLGATAAHAAAETRLGALGALDAVFSEDGGLGSALDAFESALTTLAARPEDRPTRLDVLARAEDLASTFRMAATSLEAATAELDQRLEGEIGRAAELVAEIDSLQSLVRREEVSGEEASDLRDRRDQALRELAAIVPIQTVAGPEGTVSVLLPTGAALVRAEGGTSPLSTLRDASGSLRVVRLAAGVTQDLTSELRGGSVGGLLQARDGALAEARAGLDVLAFDLASAYSSAHAAGAGLDGVTGRALFTTTATPDGAARALVVSADVAGRPERVAAAADPTSAPGDNRNALSLAALARAPVSGGRTANEALSDRMAAAGTAIASSDREASLLEAARSQVAAMRSSVSGVSSDDEMISLSQYQRAYEASLRVIQTADRMLEELLALKR
jgi:flagellar hook-associated protein 1 FlgK